MRVSVVLCDRIPIARYVRGHQDVVSGVTARPSTGFVCFVSRKTTSQLPTFSEPVTSVMRMDGVGGPFKRGNTYLLMVSESPITQR